MIFLCSVFRDCAPQVPHYIDQAEAFRAALLEPLHVIAVEGDSDDDTYMRLTEDPRYDTVLKAEHGGPKFPSVVHPLRWRQISVPCNAALCAAMRLSQPGDRTVYVESDLDWKPDTMLGLLTDLSNGLDAVAPMSMRGDRFYDIWGCVRNGQEFMGWPPYYDGWEPGTEELAKIDSAGSCFALTHEALQVAEFSAIDCIRGVGRSLRANGFSLWVDPTVRVEHP